MFCISARMFIEAYFVVFFATGGWAQSITDGFRNCRNNQPQMLNSCLLREIKRMQPRFAAGIPEMGLPPIDPAQMNSFAFRQAAPPVAVNAEFRNVMVSGFSAFDMKYLDMNWENRKFSIGMTVPFMTTRGLYRMGGKVFELPIEGEGNFIMRMDGVIIEMEGSLVQKGDKVTMENIRMGFQVKDMKTKMDKLFPNNKILSDTIHHFLNENGQLVLDEIRPGISKQLNEFTGNLMNSILGALPLDTIVYIPNTNTRDSTVGNRNVGDTTGVIRIS